MVGGTTENTTSTQQIIDCSLDLMNTIGSNQKKTYQGSQELYDSADMGNTQEPHVHSHTETAVEKSSTSTLPETVEGSCDLQVLCAVITVQLLSGI